ALAFVVPTGFVDMTREDGSKVLQPTFDAWVEGWTPKDTLAARALRDKTPYDVWVQSGWLNGPPGKHIRLDYAAARIAEATTEYAVKLLAYDNYAYSKLADELDAMNVTVPQIM